MNAKKNMKENKLSSKIDYKLHANCSYQFVRLRALGEGIGSLGSSGVCVVYE